MNGKKKSFRTDIAYEELFEEVENEDCSYHVKRIQDVVVNHVKVHKEQNCLDKVVGDYIGIEFNELQDASIRKQIIEVCTLYLKDLLEQIYPIKKVLIVGLGNKDVIADALGCRTCEQLLVSAHLNLERKVAVFTPGVVGQTGLDTVQMVKSIVDFYKPDIVIAIDALATKDIKRLNRVIQITNTGIQPGSGIGYSKGSIDKHTMGVNVIAIGVSTVIDIVSIVSQVVNDGDFTIDEQWDLIVTPKEMDYELMYLSNIVSTVINDSLFS